MTNEYPDVWFDTFLAPEVAAPVDRELEFIARHFPLPAFGRLLDVPCGIGRHAGPLSDRGYRVMGIDRSERALAVAGARYPALELRALDMFDLGGLDQTFDGLLCLWQSFGYGTSQQNLDLLAAMRGVLRPGGRLLMDLYNADAAARLPAESSERRAGRTVHTKRTRTGRRMRVDLRYSDSDLPDAHEWELYGPDELAAMAERVGFDVITRCAWFDPDIAPSADHMRMQFLMERRPRA